MSRTVAKPWPIDWTGCTAAEGATPEQQAAAAASAGTWLWAASGRRYGEFVTIEDAYRTACSDACAMPYKDSQGRWRNGVIGQHDCCLIELYRQPVTVIDAVAAHGEALDPADYAIDQNRLLRVGACWPCCDDCEPGCVVVDYQWGVKPTGMAIAAASELACELLAGLTGDPCRLPSRAVSISRQGVSIDMETAEQFAAEGLTGLPITDAWIRAVNPNGLRQRSRVLSPDLSGRT